MTTGTDTLAAAAAELAQEASAQDARIEMLAASVEDLSLKNAALDSRVLKLESVNWCNIITAEEFAELVSNTELVIEHLYTVDGSLYQATSPETYINLSVSEPATGAGTYQAGTRNGSVQSVFTISAASGQEIKCLWVMANLNSPRMVSDAILAQSPWLAAYALEGTTQEHPTGAYRLNNVTIVGIATGTNSAGHTITQSESAVAILEDAPLYVDAPVGIDCRWVSLSATPTYVAGKIESLSLIVMFAPAA